MEAHHLIPMSIQKDFTNSLDVPGNIISVCPNCHRKLHYACLEDKEGMINILYEKRKKGLERFGIDISLNELFKLY
jgi:5-methylcytosine-specific restriction protein A